MLLRPARAVWFELLLPRDELARALRVLAATGRVELQAHSDTSAAYLLPRLRAALDEYRQLAQSYGAYWPPPAAAPLDTARELEQIPRAALEQLHVWAAAADPLITRLQQLGSERGELALLHGLLSARSAQLPNLALFAQSGPVLARRAYLLAEGSGELAVPPGVLVERIPADARTYLLAVGPEERIGALDEDLIAREARRIVLPAQLPAEPQAGLAMIEARTLELTREDGELRAQLERLHAAHNLAAALADLNFVEWLVAEVPELSVTEHFAWITGWTSDPAGAALQSALRRARLHFLLRFPAAPTGIPQPVLLHNPRWVQPFELFARLLGMPAASEADPSLILAVLAPVMFGFMFGDVAQGAILVGAGVALRRRYPQVALLIPGGLAAMAFGLAFGSVFAREDVLPALWLRPLDAPLVLLRVSLVFGSGVILLGLLLDAIQHYWAGQARSWWSTRAGLVLCYVAAIGALYDARTLWLVPAGLCWYSLGGAALAPGGRLAAFGASVGESLEIMLQLVVNTVSFVRVGAFALAHAGLAAAISGLAAGAASRPLAWLILLLGNALVLVAEGLVVAIQTTRLVLFEFFIRFLHGSGRPFRPLPQAAGPASPRTKE